MNTQPLRLVDPPPSDPRDRFGSDAPIVITSSDVDRAITEERQLRQARGFHAVYDLVVEHGHDRVLQWVKDAVIAHHAAHGAFSGDGL